MSLSSFSYWVTFALYEFNRDESSVAYVPKCEDFCKCDQFFQVSPNVTHCFKCELLFQRGHFLKCDTFFSNVIFFQTWPIFLKCDIFFKVWPTFSSLTYFLKCGDFFFQCDPFFVTHFSKCEDFSGLNNFVWPIFSIVTDFSSVIHVFKCDLLFKRDPFFHRWPIF